MTDVYIGPIEHMESQTVECWCRHCEWWKGKHKAIGDKERAVVEAAKEHYGWHLNWIGKAPRKVSEHGEETMVLYPSSHGKAWEGCPVCAAVDALLEAER
jgi:hypothetical protein